MPSAEVRGRCLCHRVSYAIRGHLGIFQYCHCSRCRKVTGSAFAANLLVAPDDFRWLGGEEFVGRYALPEAKHFATAFCRHCGSALPWLAQSGKAVVVPAGSLEEDPAIRPLQNVFWSARAAWYVAPNTLPAYEELPPKRR